MMIIIISILDNILFLLVVLIVGGEFFCHYGFVLIIAPVVDCFLFQWYILTMMGDGIRTMLLLFVLMVVLYV